MSRARQTLTKLGDEFIAVTQTAPKAWALTKQQLDDPVVLERFALSCHTAAQALIQLAERTRELAGDILDADDE